MKNLEITQENELLFKSVEEKMLQLMELARICNFNFDKLTKKGIKKTSIEFRSNLDKVVKLSKVIKKDVKLLRKALPSKVLTEEQKSKLFKNKVN